MAVDPEKFQRSIRACLANARRLLEDAELWTNQSSTALALALLAQEECAKAFVLALVRDAILPWTDEVRCSVSIHECKHLVSVIMEWLLAVNELRLKNIATREKPTEPDRRLPPDVATAMNIYRHEMIERIGRRNPERYSEWRGRARKVADGQRDRKKQAALYVSVGKDGDVASQPSASEEGSLEEIARARTLLEFAGDVDRNCIFAYREYELFTEIFRAMFKDLSSEPEDTAAAEEVTTPSGIPGVVLVRRTITVADIVDSDSDQGDPSN